MMILEDNVPVITTNLRYTEAVYVDNKAVFLDDSFGGLFPEQRAHFISQFSARHSTEIKTKTLIFSASPGEKLDDKTWKDIITYALYKLGYNHTAYIAVRHVDTEVDHIHTTLSRVDLDGKILRSSFSWNKCKAVAREIEQVFGLVPLEEKYNDRRLSRREYQAQNHNFETKSGYMRSKLDTALEKSFTLKDLSNYLKQDDIEMRLKDNNWSDPVGISYCYKEQATSGRKLGNKYKIRQVVSKLESTGFGFPMDFDVKGSIEFYRECVQSSTSWNELSLKLETRDMKLKHDDDDKCFFLYLKYGNPLPLNMQSQLQQQLLLWFRQFEEQRKLDEEYRKRCEEVNGRDSILDTLQQADQPINFKHPTLNQDQENPVKKSKGIGG